MTLKEVIWQAVKQLIREGETEFTADAICSKSLHLDPLKKRASILSTLSGLTKGRIHPFYTEKDQFLEKVQYNLYKFSPTPKYSLEEKNGSQEPEPNTGV